MARVRWLNLRSISTHAPAGGATNGSGGVMDGYVLFLLTPLREGRPALIFKNFRIFLYFYSRPCGRGDTRGCQNHRRTYRHFYSRPCGRGDRQRLGRSLMNL